MTEKELIEIWKSSPEIEQVKFKKSRLMINLQSSLDNLHKITKYGILIETIAAFITIPIFLSYIYFVPHLLSKIASGSIVVWVVFILFQLKKIKKGRPNQISKSYLAYLIENQKYLELLIGMSKTILYWYILPPLVFSLLFVLGFNLKMPLLITVVTSFIILSIGMYIYQKWIAKVTYLPRLEKINRMIELMRD